MEAIFQIFLILLAVLAGTELLARRTAIAPAILLLLAGIALAFVPGMPPLELPLPVEPSELAPAKIPREADDGPVEMLLFTLRSNAPALARWRLACWSLGLRRATSSNAF